MRTKNRSFPEHINQYYAGQGGWGALLELNREHGGKETHRALAESIRDHFGITIEAAYKWIKRMHQSDQVDGITKRDEV